MDESVWLQVPLPVQKVMHRTLICLRRHRTGRLVLRQHFPKDLPAYGYVTKHA